MTEKRRENLNNTLILVCTLWIIIGCGFLNKDEVPKDQIKADLADKTFKAEEDGMEWSFKDNQVLCFSPIKEETKYTDTNADIELIVGAWNGSSTVIGKMSLSYKKAGDQWTLEESKATKLMVKSDSEDFDKFLENMQTICGYFKEQK